MRYSPSQVFAVILKKKRCSKLKADSMGIHRTFYELRQKNPEIMSQFQFVKKGNPFSITLEEVLTWFQLVGALKQFNPYYTEFSVDKDKVEELLPEDMNGFDDFKGLEEFDQCVIA